MTSQSIKATSSTDQELIQFFEYHERGLLDAWKSAGGTAPNEPGYQGPADGLSRMVFPAYKIFKDQIVLDIGCNSGLNTLAISLLAKKVTGCDTDEVYIRRAMAGRDYLGKFRDVANIEFSVGDFSTFLDEEITAIAAGRILYHIGDYNVDRLKEFIKGRSSFAMVVHTRPGRSQSRTTAYNGLIEVADVTAFLHDCGLAVVDEWGTAKQKVLIAKKPVKDTGF
jgi:SAM-dependent methyltransferase